MNREEIKDFVREITNNRNVRFDDYDKWVSFSCVLSQWKHETRRDTSASAGISITEGTSIYNCYACKTKGPLSYVLRELEKFTGESWAKLIREIESDEYLGGTLGQWGKQQDETTLNEPLDKEVYLDLYDAAWGVGEARQYLENRSIWQRNAERLNLLFDPADSDGDARILFPVHAPNGDLHGFTGRAISPKARLKVRDYHGLKKKLLLLGSHLLKRPPYIILVEGLFDYARMRGMGYPTVASMMSELTPEQAKVLRAFGKPVYCFYDDDEAGRAGLESVKEGLCKHVPVSKVRYPRKARIQTPDGGLRPPSDPGELLQHEVEGMLNDSRLV